MADQLIGGVQNGAATAVVLLELDLVLHPVFAQKIRHVADPCATKRIDALVIIAHREHRTLGPTQLLEPSVLQPVGVLKLIDQQMTKTQLVVLAQRLLVAQQFVRAQQQFPKIHHPFACALRLVEFVDLDFFAGVRIGGVDVFGPKCIFLATVDEPLGLLGWKALVIDVELFVQALDRRELILDVQDLKGLRQLRQLPMGPQQTVAQAMESPDPHAPHVDGQHGRQAGHHFSGRFVGEGHRHHPTGAHLSRVHQPSDAGGQHPGLARTCPSQNQGMLIGQGDGTQLFVIEVGQQGWGAVQALVLGFGHALHCRKRMGVESDTGPKILAPGFFAPANQPAQAKRSPSLA